MGCGYLILEANTNIHETGKTINSLVLSAAFALNTSTALKKYIHWEPARNFCFELRAIDNMTKSTSTLQGTRQTKGTAHDPDSYPPTLASSS